MRGGVARIREALEETFEDRPYCIIATIDRKDDKADLRRRKLDPGPTPIEREIDRVNLGSRGRTVTLTAETARNAAAFLRTIDEDEER